MRIVLASDHAGFDHKEAVHRWLEHHGHEVANLGTANTERVDYPDFVRPAALAVAHGDFARGIVFGGSGNGEAMVANRVHGIRCALCWNEDSARLARQHNNANMLAIGQRLVPLPLALRIVEIWLNTPFDGDRHLQRIRKIDAP